MTRLAVIGVGEQARRSHLVCLLHAQQTGHDVAVVALADFASQLGKLDPFTRRITRRARHVVVDGESGAPFSLSEARFVVESVRAAGADAVVVATEPLVHDLYMEALEEAGLPYLLDKPFICPRNVSVDIDAADAGLERWRQARDMWAGSGLGCINISRRFDGPLGLARTELRRSYGKVNQLSYVYADGEVRDRDGCLIQQQHPFRHGYGALNHSAYHAFDTALWLCGFDERLADVDQIRVQTLARTVGDYLAVTNGDRDLDPVASRAEYDCAVNVALSFRDGGTTLLSFSIVHDSPTNRDWEQSTTTDQVLHLGRLSHEVISVIQGEHQSLTVRRQEVPRSPGDATPRRLHSATVTRNPLYAASVDRPTYEVLADHTNEKKHLEASGKWQAFNAFLAKANGSPYDRAIDVDMHLFTQLVVLLAARSIADEGRTQRWTEKGLE